MTEPETADDTQKKAAVDTAGEKETAEPEETAKDTGTDSLVRLTIDVPWKDVEKEMDEALAQHALEMKLPGFRRGKVPLEVVKSRYKEVIKDDVVKKIVEKALYEKIETDEIRIASPPVMEKLDYREGENLKAEIAVEVFPTIEIPELETVEVEIPADRLKFEEYNEEKQIDAVLERNRREVPVTGREIRGGDYVVLKYQSKMLQSKRMTPKKTAQFQVKEEEEFEILDLYKELPGKKIHDSITLKRTYPDDYKKKPWAGKELEHYITVESIFEMKKPELNEVFLKSIGFDDVAGFKQKMKDEYRHYMQNQVEEKKVKFILGRLIETVVFTVPEGVLAEGLERTASQYPYNKLDFNDEKGGDIMAALKAETERSVRISLITDAIREKYNLAVSNDELEKEYKTIAEKNNVPLKEVRKAYMNKENVRQLRENLLNEKVVGLLKEKVKIKEI
jgi:trigger factor